MATRDQEITMTTSSEVVRTKRYKVKEDYVSLVRITFSSSMISLAVCGALVSGCAETPSETDEIIDNLRQAGFPASDIMIVDGTVLVGRDAVVSLEASREMLESGGPGQEQYRTTNLIGPAITKICVNGLAYTGTFSTALDRAIQNYDELPLRFSMARTPSTGCSATIVAAIDPLLEGGVAGFPAAGLPFPTITLGSQMSQYGVDTIQHVITHELGHAIGFRHTDYFNRFISCGEGGNEGAGIQGAIHIPGTPTGASVGASLMNSCFRSSETGEFTGGDLTALLALYGLEFTTMSFYTYSNHVLVAAGGGGSHLAANSTAIGAWERFFYSDVNGGELVNGDIINLRAANGSFVVAEGGGGGVVNANRTAPGPYEAFRINNVDGFPDFQTGNHVSLQATNLQFVQAINGGGGSGSGSVKAAAPGVGPWETFMIRLQ
jgi:hypothetical protein